LFQGKSHLAASLFSWCALQGALTWRWKSFTSLTGGIVSRTGRLGGSHPSFAGQEGGSRRGEGRDQARRAGTILAPSESALFAGRGRGSGPPMASKPRLRGERIWRKTLRRNIQSEGLFSGRVGELSPGARHRIEPSVYFDVRAFFRPANGVLTFRTPDPALVLPQGGTGLPPRRMFHRRGKNCASPTGLFQGQMVSSELDVCHKGSQSNGR
jgi:hypothetical protein